MVWIRYLSYFAIVAGVMALLTLLEIAHPGSLRFYEFADPTETIGTSEFSPVEIMQPIILALCGATMAWVAWHYPSQRPVAFPFGGVALAFFIRELDYFLDRYVAANFWQVLIAIAAAFVIAYTYRHRRRLQVALGRLWPSPGFALLFAGAIILFAFVRLAGSELLWQSILGDDYRRIVTFAVEELVELAGYLLWMVGCIEYSYEVRAIAEREPIPTAVKRRQTRLGRKS